MPRGRPRKFDEDQALTGAMLLFWEKGLSATSLDDLTQAMNMNRPSIYNAFGNKETIYRKALDRFCGQLDRGLAETLQANIKLRDGLTAFFEQAIGIYCGSGADNQPPMGCLMMCTAPSEAFNHPEVGEDLQALIKRLDKAFCQRLKRAKSDGQVPDSCNPELTAKLLQATLQSIALRARAGAPSRELKKIAAYAIDRLLA